MPNRPYFDTIEMKGGGDAVSAARAVLQTGEYDYAWNLQVEDEVLQAPGSGRQGPGRHRRRAATSSTSSSTSPIRGTRSTASAPASRPSIRSSPTRRCARRCRCWSTAERCRSHLRPHRHRRPRNFINNPSQFRSPNTKWEFNIDKANALLDAAGWKRGADGIRAKDGKKLKFVFQTSINAPRQKNQAIIKQACQKAGIEIELKSVTASVFFSSDVANPDTYPKFYADMQMYTTTMTAARSGQRSWTSTPRGRSRRRPTSGRAATSRRWRNAEYDALYHAGRSRARSGQARGALHQDATTWSSTTTSSSRSISRPRVRGGALTAGDARCRAGTSTSRPCRTGTATRNGGDLQAPAIPRAS